MLIRLCACLLVMFLPLINAGCSDRCSFIKQNDCRDVLVTRVIDGDTFQIEDGKRVRLIGIDTPEIHFSKRLKSQSESSKKDIETIKALGQKAALFTKELIEGKKVRLEFDVDKYDRYKRLLAYVYLEDNTFVNAEIVRQGYAQMFTVPPNVKYKDVFLEAQREARQNNRGLWGE